jgi:hypothetical protein
VEFTNRQILITRIYSNKRWLMGGLAHISYCVTLIYAGFVIVSSIAAGEPWIQLVLVTLLIPLLAAMKGALRTVGVDEVMPQWRGPLTQWNWVWMTLAPFVSFLFSWNFICSLLSKRIVWRGIRYELVSPMVTHVLKSR